MDYIELTCKMPQASNAAKEILIAELADIGYESFEETEWGLNAYIVEADFNFEEVRKLHVVSNNIFGDIDFEYHLYKDRNWNEYWEKNFQPVTINQDILIRAPFHDQEPGFKYEIILEPKMSFGTGHHPTTWLMLQQMEALSYDRKSVLDLGCGTAILAIYAEMKGSTDIMAIDNNDWAYNNAKENIALNHCQYIATLLGDYSVLKEGVQYDIIVANINRNVLLEEIQHYHRFLKPGGKILFSGIMQPDFDLIHEEACKYNLTLVGQKERNEWLVLEYDN